MNRIISLYKSDLYIKNVGTELQRNDLIDQILKAKKINPEGTNNSNPKCWRLSFPCNDVDWLLKEVSLLVQNAALDYSEQDHFFKDALEDNMSIYYWANVNDPGSRNTFHSHKEDQFSLVYYLQSTGTGYLRFVNPANILGDCNNASPFTRDVILEPKEGDLILFPSWVPHEVETNFSNKQRINLAFNVRFLK